MSIKGNIRRILFSVLPISLYLKVVYRYLHGGKLDLFEPKKFSEKLFWLKLYNGQENKKVMQLCYDKFDARRYIEEKIGPGYLPELYGIYDDVDDIDFSIFPEKYVIKITQSCGYNIINNGELEMSQEKIMEQLRKWQQEINDLSECRKRYKEESYYYTGKAKIICEEYLEDSNSDIVTDSAFFCFNGEPKYYDIVYDSVKLGDGLKSEELFYRNIYDIDKQYIPMELGRPTDEKLGNKNFENFNKMIEISERLSKDFPFLRVDLYNIEGRIVVGELTWIPMGGGGKITPEEFDYEWGKLLKLPDVKIDFKNYKRCLPK
ncbi:MAG: hypothetical protein GX663_02075 [Clostridiales bacterium]|nr:hypothetical protein [Clostridiales bacterium]